MTNQQTQWRKFFVLAALEAGAAFYVLASLPHTGSAYSFSRLSMLGLLFTFLVLCIYLFVRTPRVLIFLTRPFFTIVSGLLAVIITVVLFLLRYLDPGHFLQFYQRLSPLLYYLLVLTVQFSIFTLALHYGIHVNNLTRYIPVYLSALIAFCSLLLFLIFIIITRIGLTPDKAYWGEPGIPLMGWQMALAVLAGFLILLLGYRLPSSPDLDVILPTALWLLAVLIWLSVPISVLQNSFYAPMNPPYNQPFPNSDAGYYDSMAQSLLIGYPYLGDIPTRPLYIVFLAFFHLLVGERYYLIIAGQTLILALYPVVLYFLGRRLHSQTAGVIIALFAIFREWTSLLVSSETRVSNSKTLLVDLPTLLLVLMACLFVLRWLERRSSKTGIVAGGMFGVMLLLRTQSILILPCLIVLVILVYGLRNRGWILALTIFLIGFGVTIAPWLLHNYLKSGQLTFDAPFQYQVIASQYQYTGNLELQNVDLQGKSLFGILLAFVLKDPKFVVGFIATHFFATQINSLLALPLIEPYNGPFAHLNLYWMTWDGSLSLSNFLLVLFYLAIIAIGIGAAWMRLRWIGLTPLAFSVGYSLANGIGRFSGWRYDLPADWISYFYFGLGVAEILWQLVMLFGAMRVEMVPPTSHDTAPVSIRSHPLSLTFAPIIVFMLVGALPWIVEGLTEPRFTEQTSEKLVVKLSDSSSVQRLGVNGDQIESFVKAPQTTLQIGYILYPRFFTRNLGLASSHPWPAYAPREFPRLGFVLINQSRYDEVFPSRNSPDLFPSAADAIVLGCQRTDYIEVRLILFPDSDIAYLSSPLTVPCN